MDGQRRFDVLIIGGGQAGVPLAHALAEAGKIVALAEERHLGGSCVNFGCTPTKAAIASARVAYLARRAADFGLQVSNVEVDFPAVLARAKDILMQSRRALEQRMESAHNPTWLHGHARIEGRDGATFRVRVDGEVVSAAQLVLDTGTRTRVPPIEGLAEVDILHAENWLDKPELPEHLAILGGGYIGLEMSQFYRRMGSCVTVIERSPQILDREDGDVAQALQRVLEGEGIAFVLKADVRRVERHDDRIRLTLETDGRSTEIGASHVFVATGRMPMTSDLGLETIGVEVSEKGYAKVDDRLLSSVNGIWVAGDIRGGPQFTHTAWDDYRILFSQLAGDGTRTQHRIVPYAVFTDPPLGRVGMSEGEARRSGRPIRVARFDIGENSKAREIGETAGFVKVIADEETHRLLGAAVLAPEGAELVHVYVDLMNADVPYTVIHDAIHIHPTLAEAVQSAVSRLDRVCKAR